ncbi:hypothetical protein HD554DRAFT_2096586 [Boletus coccyginus]|nr:hypothetical protein HD554DRAFT_2096586 [Boletus coccyginus]
MPKRIPTPPPADDEPKYLTVVHPYAISGTCNMELRKDREDFARWVACCINKDAFFAIFHKPSSRGMVIIEITRDYPHFDRILGEHRWSEFLQKPTKEEKGRATQVFYCTYSTGRIVQKNGWKRIDVDEAWFKAWSPNNGQIKSPYPPTHFCDVPVEDRTNHSLCRPLPGAAKPPPPVQVIAAPQPVVGSAAWIQRKEGGPSPVPITVQSKPPGAFDKGAPGRATSARPNPTANGSVKKVVGIPQGSHAGMRLPAIGGGTIAVKSNNVWQNTGKKSAPSSVVMNWDESAPVSRQGTPASHATPPVATHQARENAWETGPTHPPGLAVPGTTASVVQNSATGWDSTGVSTSSPDSESGPDLATAPESDNPYNVHIRFSESMEEDFHGMGIRAIDDDDDDDDGLGELDSIAPGAWYEPAGAEMWDPTAVAGWDDDPLDAADLWVQNQEPEEPELCKAHGTICRKGICAEYAKQVRDAKRAEEAEQRKAAAANKGKKGGRNKGRGAGKKNDENEPSDKNTTQNNQFRGPGVPVKTNWRGAPRAIVSAETIEKREATKAVSDDGWGNSDTEFEPNAAATVPTDAVDAASEASWGISEGDYDPWADAPQPVTKASHSGGKPQGKKNARQTKGASNWADQVDGELAANSNAGGFQTVSSKRGSKRGSSTTSRGTRSAKSSSTSGWGNVPDMPW